MGREYRIPERLVIKKSFFRKIDIIPIMSSSILFVLYVWESNPNHLIIGLVILLFTIVYFIVRSRPKDRFKQIAIDETGILLSETDTLLKWDDIKYAYIIRDAGGAGNNTVVISWFHIETSNQQCYDINITDFRYNKKLLAQYINHFSKREIGDISNELTYNISLITGDKELANKMYITFRHYFKQQLNYGAIGVAVWIVLLALTGYLQANTYFPYLFALGWTILIVAIWVLNAYLTKTGLRNNPLFKYLDDTTYQKITNEYSKAFSNGYLFREHKGFNTTVAILAIISIIVAFTISYFVSN